MIDTKKVRQSLLQDRAVTDAIRRRAHQLSLERGYSTPQHMADDWFRAENEVLEKLIEEEIKRRQKMNAAISEGAMAEEAVPAVTLPPDLTQQVAEREAAVKKPVARRKKVAAAPSPAESAPDAVTQPIAPETTPTEAVTDAVALEAANAAAGKPRRTRKKSATAAEAAATAAAEPAASAPAKPKAAKSAKKKSS